MVVNYGTCELVSGLVKSIFDTVKTLKYEIIVVDNSKSGGLRFSCDDERVRVFWLNENKGFANASNFGAKKAISDCLLFLNSDSIVYDGSVDQAFSYFSCHKNVGVLGIRQLLPSGELDFGCKRGFPTPMASLYYFSGLSRIFRKSRRFGAYQQTFVDEKSVAEVDCVSGAFMMIKKSVFDRVGGFDETFFLYGEDVDLCYRLKCEGFRNIYFGRTYFTHLKNSSGRGSVAVVRHFYDSMEIFYDKHYKKKYGVVTEILVKFAIRFKCFFAKFGVFSRRLRRNLFG